MLPGTKSPFDLAPGTVPMVVVSGLTGANDETPAEECPGRCAACT